jgi:CRP/FNR family nitrogen fixation transcriptional regulator
MLLGTNTTSRRPIDGHLAALAGERAFCSPFRYRRGAEVFGEGEDAEYVCQINMPRTTCFSLGERRLWRG